MVALREALAELQAPVAADLFENDDAYLLVIDLPGATAEQTTISTANGHIQVEADRSVSASDATAVRTTRSSVVSFELPLPPDATGEAARASLADGVLELTIPREEPGVTIPIEDG